MAALRIARPHPRSGPLRTPPGKQCAPAGLPRQGVDLLVVLGTDRRPAADARVLAGPYSGSVTTSTGHRWLVVTGAARASRSGRSSHDRADRAAVEQRCRLVRAPRLAARDHPRRHPARTSCGRVTRRERLPLHTRQRGTHRERRTERIGDIRGPPVRHVRRIVRGAPVRPRGGDGRVGIDDLEERAPGGRRGGRVAHDAADLVPIRSAQKGEVHAGQVVVPVQREVEHRRVELPRRAGIRGHQVVAQQRVRLVHELAADVRPPLPQAELRTGRIPHHRHPTLVGDVHRLHQQRAARVRGPSDRRIEIVGRQVDVPPELGRVLVGIRHQRGDLLAAEQTHRVPPVLLGTDVELPAEDRPVEGHRPVEIRDAQVDPGGGAEGLIRRDRAHRCSSVWRIPTRR